MISLGNYNDSHPILSFNMILFTITKFIGQRPKSLYGTIAELFSASTDIDFHAASNNHTWVD